MPITDFSEISVIIPAKNEAESLRSLLPKIAQVCPGAEIIVVNDGSTDDTRSVCELFSVRTINNPYSKGNGAAVKSGARAAKNKYLVLMDADGQHDPEYIPALVEKLLSGYDLVIGARNLLTHASIARACANTVYNRLASWIVGQPILDLTSGYRAVRREKFREFLSLLPNGFSYPTTSTMAFFRSGYSVAYLPIHANKRVGKSHIKLAKDGARFFLIIFKIGTLYSPLKIFLPISLFFFCTGLGYYLFTYINQGRFTNMSALLFVTSVLTFLIGLVSEQITALMFKKL